MILLRSGLGLLMGKFRQFFTELSARNTIMAGIFVSCIYFYLNYVFMHLFIKMHIGMTNSVDPDQTAPPGAV